LRADCNANPTSVRLRLVRRHREVLAGRRGSDRRGTRAPSLPIWRQKAGQAQHHSTAPRGLISEGWAREVDPSGDRGLAILFCSILYDRGLVRAAVAPTGQPATAQTGRARTTRAAPTASPRRSAAGAQRRAPAWPARQSRRCSSSAPQATGTSRARDRSATPPWCTPEEWPRSTLTMPHAATVDVPATAH
jgi:hypothetical protein